MVSCISSLWYRGIPRVTVNLCHIIVPAGSVTPTATAKGNIFSFYSILICISLFACLCGLLDAFAMGKVHKEIAMFMMSSVEDSEKTDQLFIKVRLCHVLCGTILRCR
jgi:hypothetical protein